MVLYEKYDPQPAIIAKCVIPNYLESEGFSKEEAEKSAQIFGMFIPITLDITMGCGSGTIVIPESTRQFTSFKVNGVETLKKEPIVDLGTVNPIAVEISEAAQGPLFTEESLITGASKLNVKFSKPITHLGLYIYLDSLGSMNIANSLEMWMGDPVTSSLLEIISDTEFNLNVKALVGLFATELPGLDYTTVKSTLWGTDDGGNTVEYINSFNPKVWGYSGGEVTTGNTELWEPGEYEIIMKFDRNSKPNLHHLFNNSIPIWKEIEFRCKPFEESIQFPFFTYIGSKSIDYDKYGEWSTSLKGKDELEKIIFPESLIEVETSAVCYCNCLKEINIPINVKKIAYSAFDRCENLTDINIPDGVIEMSSDAFQDSAWWNNQPDGLVYLNKVLYKYKGEGKNNIIDIHVKEGTICIADDALQYCRELTSITLPNSLKSIGDYAFGYTEKLLSINIPESVISIGCGAFSHALWYSNLPDGLVYLNKVLYKYKGTMPENTSIEIKGDIVSISPEAFFSCYNLISITLPENIKEIKENTFAQCRNLSHISIPKNVVKIEADAFNDCKSMAYYDFSQHTKVPILENSAFYDIPSTCQIKVPASLYLDWISAPNWSEIREHIISV